LANVIENSRKLSLPEKEMISAFGGLLSAIQNVERMCATNTMVTPADDPKPYALISVDTEKGNNSVSDDATGYRASHQARQLLLQALETFGHQAHKIIGTETKPKQGGNTTSGGGLRGPQNSNNRLQLENDPVQRAIYAGIAFVDERMLAFDWQGRQEWLERPMESELWGSRSAGQKIFRHIEELRVGALGDGVLAALYLSMLNLGFAGMYTAEDAREKLPAHKRALFQFLTHGLPDLNQATDKLMESGQNVISTGAVNFLPYLRPWVIGGIVIALAFILTNQFLWFSETAELRDGINQLLREMGY